MSGTIVLNPEFQVRNIVSAKDIRETTILTLKQLVKELLDVSGPFSNNAFILKNVNTLMAGMDAEVIGKYGTRQEFTRDGIRTLESTQYASPIQRYIKDELLSWIGKRVDASCHDGTTTSMLFCASFLIYALESRHHNDGIIFRLTDVENVFDEIRKAVLAELEQYKITVTDIKAFYRDNLGMDITDIEARTVLARMQAHTSSSGNMQIADAVGKVVANTPNLTDNFNNILIRTPHVETAENCVVAKKEPYQYYIQTTILNTKLLNNDNNTTFSGKADVLVLSSGVADIGYLKRAIQTYIATSAKCSRYKNGERVFVILIPALGCNNNMMTIDSFIENEFGIPVFPLMYHRPPTYELAGCIYYAANGLCYKANTTPVDESSFAKDFEDGTELDQYIAMKMIRDCYIKSDRCMTYFNDIIPNYRNDITDEAIKRNVHPGEISPDMYANYTSGKALLNQQYELFMNQPTVPSEIVRTDIRRTLGDMTVINNWYVEINGKLHDQKRYQSIIEDAAGATASALTHGVLFNAPVKLWMALVKVLANLEASGKCDPVRKFFLMALMGAAKDIIFASFGKYATNVQMSLASYIARCEGKWDFFDIGSTSVSLERTLDLEPFSYLNENSVKEISVTCKDECTNFASVAADIIKETEDLAYPPCQVGNMFDVLFTRLGEVALRFIFTDNIVALDAIWNDGSIPSKS